MRLIWFMSAGTLFFFLFVGSIESFASQSAILLGDQSAGKSLDGKASPSLHGELISFSIAFGFAKIKARAVLVEPENPVATAILLPSAQIGKVEFELSDKSVKLNHADNFLVRERGKLLKNRVAVLLLETLNLTQADRFVFRKQRGQLVSEVLRFAVATLRDRSKRPIWLVGMNGGIESAFRFTAKSAAAIRGMILLWNYKDPTKSPHLTHLPLERVSIPVLMITHADDPCYPESPELMTAIKARLRAASIQLIQIQGQNSTAGASCTNKLDHGFFPFSDKLFQASLDFIRRH